MFHLQGVAGKTVCDRTGKSNIKDWIMEIVRALQDFFHHGA